MAEVLVYLRVMPASIEVNLEDLEAKIKSAISPEKIVRKPIAFGIVALEVLKVVPDAGGVVDELEQKLKSIKEVGEVEIIGITRGL